MKYDWQKICDGFAKELKQFLEKNGYEKFALSPNGEAPNPNVDFLICFLQKYNIPLDSEELNSEDLKDGVCGYDSYSWYNRRSCFSFHLEFATICPAIRNEISLIQSYWRIEYRLSTIRPLIWAFESDIKEMSKVIEFDYIPDNIYPEGLTADQLEWVEMQDIDYKIIRGETDPSKNPRWLGYTADQRELVAKVYSLHLANKNNFQGMEEIDYWKFKR